MFDLPPFPVGGLDLPVGTGNTSWCIVCVCQHNPPLAVRYYELWRSEWLRDRCSMYLTEWSMRSSEEVFRSVEEMECSNGSDI